MGYLVIFKSGHQLRISQEHYAAIFLQEVMASIYINRDNVDYAVSEDTIENARSGVVTPPTPGEIKNAKEKELEKIRSNPQVLISRIKEKADEDV